MKFTYVFSLLLCTYLHDSNSFSGKRKGDLFMWYENSTPGTVMVNCGYCSDDRQPTMKLEEQMPSNEIKVSTYVSNVYNARDKCYLVTTQLVLLDAFLQQTTTFECVLKNTMTGHVINTTMVYVQSAAKKTVFLKWLPLVALVVNILQRRWS